MREQWEPIEGFDGYYEVSDLGNVRSWKNARWGRRNSPVLLRPWRTEKGYLCVTLGDAKMRVHRLVLLSFAGSSPPGKDFVLHADGNPANNALSNLRWGTPQENSDDMVKHGSGNRGEKANQSSLTELDVLTIRSLRRSGVRACDIASMFGVSRPTVSDITKRRTWAWLN